MFSEPIERRRVLTGTAGLLGLMGLAACAGSTTSSSATSSATNATTTTASAGAGGGAGFTSLETLVSQVGNGFTASSYTDATTGTSLPYNVFLPKGYSPSTKYPLVLYIGDASLVGKAVTAPLSQYGALVWAGTEDQSKHPSIVVVPEYPEVILDDHSGYTMTPYVDLTARFVAYLKSHYSVDPARVYGTGQSMGCMTVMYLAAQHPDLFAAELLVSGQWDIGTLAGLAKEKFCYIAAGGDAKATGGQTEVKAMLVKDGVPFQEGTWDATWSAQQADDAAKRLLAAGDAITIATFTTGTVLTANPSAGNMEHMASFMPAYRITALRDWLFAQQG